MASACALAIFSGKIIFNSQFWKICGFSRIAFSREGDSLSQSLTALPAPSGREPLARPQTLRFSRKLYRHAKGPILEGAVAVGDWGSFSRHSAKASPSGELARERLRGFVLIFVFLHKMFCGQGFPLDKRANVSYYI